MYLDVHSRHTLAERMALRLIVLLAWPFEWLCEFLRKVTEKLHDTDLGSLYF